MHSSRSSGNGIGRGLPNVTVRCEPVTVESQDFPWKLTVLQTIKRLLKVHKLYSTECTIPFMWLLQNVFKYVVCAWLPFSEFRLLLKCRKWLIWESEQNKLHKKSLKSTFSITKQLEKHFFDYKKSLKSTFSITKIFSIIKHVSTALHVFDHTIKPI